MNGKRARLRIYLPRALFSPPLRFARVKSKNRPKLGGFGLHKTEIFVFMRATREGARMVFKERKGRATANPLQVVSLPCARGGGLGALAAKPEGLWGQIFVREVNLAFPLRGNEPDRFRRKRKGGRSWCRGRKMQGTARMRPPRFSGTANGQVARRQP